jgi:transposase-like protein
MKGKVYTKEFKEMILQEVNETNDVAQVARRHDLSTNSVYNWRKQARHKAWDVTDPTAKKTAVYTPTAQEFKELESENGQLKQILGEKDLEIAILRDLVKKSQPGYRTKLR